MEKFIWNKKGQIFNPADYPAWGRTHGQVPYYIDINGQEKIFFTSRPPVTASGYVSYIHSADVSTEGDKIQIKKLNEKPLLSLGGFGTFDEFGTMPCSVINHPEKDEVWMYYVGWSRKQSVPYDSAVGLAISRDGGNTFEKAGPGPLIAANVLEPFVIGCPRVHLFNGKWYLFYIAGVSWFESQGRKECFYKMKMATSEDGLNWVRNDRHILPDSYDHECQTCPTVFELGGKYHMYFTYRHSVDFRNPERGYRIGYAVSSDLEKWERNDEVGNFTISESGWDAEMVCYPNVNKIHDKLIMFYCGNSFGQNGFGYAELISHP